MSTKQKLELTWIGKGDEPTLEPRILIEDASHSYGDKMTKNMLIHGDNLLALKALEQDYTGKIKCVYIDPPYNTGSAFDKYDDGLEHSIWLDLMHKRLFLLHGLLREDGIIWISIDDHESHYLKLLCDEIFGRNNFIACLPTVMNLKGNQDEFGFAGTHEYTLVYAKDKSKAKLGLFDVDEEELNKDWLEDDIGPYKIADNLRATGVNAPRSKRPNLWYPIFLDDNDLPYVTEDNQPMDTSHEIVWPLNPGGEELSWYWGKPTFTKSVNNLIIKKTKNGTQFYRKQRPKLGDIPTKKPKTLFYKPEYNTGNGTSQVKTIFGRKAFDYPKPEELISDFIRLSTDPGDFVLDSFVGSGTSAAVAHKMNRNYIAVELGEHAYDLCVPRLKGIVDGKDDVGVTKSENWKGGGGFRFYELAPSLLIQDSFGNWVISKEYNANMLAHAMSKQEGFTYSPNQTTYWKQGYSTENDYVYTTTQYVGVELLDAIHTDMHEEESLLIACKAFDTTCKDRYDNITIKKIPQILLGRCEFGKDDYSLNITEPAKAESEDEESE